MIEPLLQKVDPERPLEPNRRAAMFALRIMRLDERDLLRPRHNQVHLRQELATPSKTLKPLKLRHYCKAVLLHPAPLENKVR